MTGNLQRRLDRLTQRHALSAGRMIVVEVHDSRVHDDALLDATLAGAGISRTDHDLVVQVRRFDPSPPEPPCALLSVTALGHRRRGASR